jgi:hypothetical protein
MLTSYGYFLLWLLLTILFFTLRCHTTIFAIPYYMYVWEKHHSFVFTIIFYYIVLIMCIKCVFFACVFVQQCSFTCVYYSLLYINKNKERAFHHNVFFMFFCMCLNQLCLDQRSRCRESLKVCCACWWYESKERKILLWDLWWYCKIG